MEFTSIAAIMAAAILGAMLFFAAVVAPAVFRNLPADHAGTFLRALFPRYYDVLAVASILAAILCLGSWPAAILAAVAVLFVLARFWLMPKINAARDKREDENAARRFRMLHGLSVAINLAQMVALMFAIARLI